ncbi:MAG: DUF559 domain-containing protein [Myxococcales bacterium]|nr:DUF559 domain-containing protein [Myxococcales bacterium]
MWGWATTPACSSVRAPRPVREPSSPVRRRHRASSCAHFWGGFYASRARLVVEVDGGYHAEQVEADAPRVRDLVAQGFRVVRLPEELVVGRRGGWRWRGCGRCWVRACGDRSFEAAHLVPLASTRTPRWMSLLRKESIPTLPQPIS